MIGMQGDKVVMTADEVCVGCRSVCPDDCTDTVSYSIETPVGADAEGTFAVLDQPHIFSGTGTNGAYVDGTISLTCAESCWTVTVEICYGDNDTPTTSETWEATLTASADGCPPTGEVPVSDIDPPTDVIMTVTIG